MEAQAKNFVAINYISCRDSYRDRFEELFATRAKAIDKMPGFQGMQVLKPTSDTDAYLVVSYWESESAFREWTGSPEFIEGHQRGFADLREAERRGEQRPMESRLKMYEVIAR